MTRFSHVSLLALGLCTLATSLGGCATGRHVSAVEPRRVCESGDAQGYDSLGSLYTKGMSVPQDARRAAALYEKACMAHDADACNNLGRLYAEGHGVSRDTTHAAALYEKACMAGLAQGCNNLGLLYASPSQASGELCVAMRWLG